MHVVETSLVKLSQWNVIFVVVVDRFWGFSITCHGEACVSKTIGNCRGCDHGCGCPSKSLEVTQLSMLSGPKLSLEFTREDKVLCFHSMLNYGNCNKSSNWRGTKFETTKETVRFELTEVNLHKIVITGLKNMFEISECSSYPTSRYREYLTLKV